MYEPPPTQEQGHSQARHSLEQANNASNAINAMTRAVTSIGEMNAQIAAAAEEQSKRKTNHSIA